MGNHYTVPWFVLLLLALGEGGHIQQYGPDPWHASSGIHGTQENPTPMGVPDSDLLVPYDLRLPLPTRTTNNDAPVGEWFFKRLLIIILKNGSIKIDEDDFREISIAMKLPPAHWKVLEQYMDSEKTLDEEMYRRIVGYLSDAVYRPSFTEKVAQAWTDYVTFYYDCYRVEITWIMTILAIGLSVAVMSKYMSRKIVMGLIFVLLYLYEVFLSFKEFEKRDYDKFMTAMNGCKWKFWSSSCDIPISDPLVFWKHMHPGKIVIRMFTHLLTEPLLLLSSSVNEISGEITRDLWPPFNSVVNGVLIVVFNFMIIILIVMFVFTFLLNVPFNVSFLAGLINFGVNRQAAANNNNGAVNNTDRLSGENLQRLLNIMDRPQERQNVRNALPQLRNGRVGRQNRNARRGPPLRSLSAGRIGQRAIEYGFVR